MLTFNIIIARKGREKIKQHQLPQSWEEYKSMGLDTLAALQTILTYPNTVAKLKILKDTLKLPKATFNRLTDTDIAALIAQLDWMTLEATPEPFITEFVHNGTTYILPRSRFENGTALEYAIAEDYFKKITPENDETALINLCATLCREKTEHTAAAISAGDYRIPLTSRGEVENRAEAFKTLDPYIQVAVFLYFSGVKKFIFDTYGQAIFAQTEETDKDNPEETPDNQNTEDFGWWGVFMEIAENPKNIAAIHQMNFHELCIWLVRKKLQSDKMKQLFEKPTFKNE